MRIYFAFRTVLLGVRQNVTHEDNWKSVTLRLLKRYGVYIYCLQLEGVAYFIDVQLLGVNSVPCLITHRPKKACGREEIKIHTFLNSMLHVDE
jgi:hypothetical protein